MTRERLQKYAPKIDEDSSLLSRLLLRHIISLSPECIQLLLDKGADFNYADDINLRSSLHGYLV
jgi:hypothetical protein